MRRSEPTSSLELDTMLLLLSILRDIQVEDEEDAVEDVEGDVVEEEDVVGDEVEEVDVVEEEVEDEVETEITSDLEEIR